MGRLIRISSCFDLTAFLQRNISDLNSLDGILRPKVHGPFAWQRLTQEAPVEYNGKFPALVEKYGRAVR